MRIAVDVMGGDHGCGVVIEGAFRGLQAEKRIRALYLVGNEAEIKAHLDQSPATDPRVQVIHASEVLGMDEKPAAAVRKKRDSSIVRSVELVREGKADAVISPGNTGGIFAAATFKLGRITGVDRGGIAAVIPTPEREFVLMDSGANIECKPEHLAQFAVMGSVYSREVLGRPNPRVGILSIGTEDSKGNELTLEAFRLCKKLDLNFVGNIEGHDLFESKVEVVVCDGFVGNIVLKTCESLATAMFGMFRQELKASLRRKIGAMLAQHAFRAIKRRLDPEVGGGAPLLGFNGPVIKAHASAKEKAITNAIRVTCTQLEHHVNDLIAKEISAANERIEALRPNAPLISQNES